MRGDIEADLTGVEARGWRRRLLIVVRIALSHRVQAVMLLRVSQMLGRRCPPAAIVVKWLNQTLNGCDIAWQARIGPGLRLDHPAGVVIGPAVEAGESCSLMQGVTLGDNGGAPRLGDRVYVAPGAIVIGPVTIGDGAVIGANSVVTKSVPADAVVFGNPAEVRRRVADGG
ncbi:MAG: serine O-acetyltransferase [Solirubrobacteraceae bacterium]